MPIDLALVNPFQLVRDPIERRYGEPYFPLGPLYVAARARSKGWNVKLFDGMFTSDAVPFKKFLEQEQPGVIGFYTMNTIKATTLDWISRAKNSQRGLIIAGGPDASSDPEPYLKAGADGVLVGEGEDAILEILEAAQRGRWKDAAALSGVPGMVRANGNGDASSPRRDRLTHLDEFPFPAWDLLDLQPYRHLWMRRRGISAMSLIAGRGCPFRCTWCAKPVLDKKFITRSVENVIAELLWLKRNFNPSYLRIVDDVFVMDRRWALKFCEEVVRANAVIPFECLARVDLVNEEMLAALKRAGCRKIFYGVESGSQKILDAMKKGTQIHQIKATAKLMHRLGIKMHAYLMFGYPGEEYRDIWKTIRLVEETVPHSAGVTVTYPIKGTEFYNQVRHEFLESNQWTYSNQNLSAFRTRYPSWVYRWATRLTQTRLQLAQVFKGLAPFHRLPKIVLKNVVYTSLFVLSAALADRLQARHDEQLVRKPGGNDRPQGPN